MSKTFRRVPWSMFRHPGGKRNAVRNKARAIPPSSWDDIQFNLEAYGADKRAFRMLKKGWSEDHVALHLSQNKRFNLSYKRALQIVRENSRYIGSN